MTACPSELEPAALPTDTPLPSRTMFAPIPEILDEIRAGRMVVLVDDEDRENEGDLVLAAQFATPENINAITRLAGGYLCLSLTPADCDRLDLHPQTAFNTTLRGTPFTVSIDGHPKHGVGTGISATDRAKTVQIAIDPRSGPEDVVKPGHINPLRSREGGVLVRTGQTEGAVDLCRLAGVYPAALIIEIVKEDGQMARRPDLEIMCRKHGWKMGSVEQIIEYRLQRERLVRRLEPESGTPIRTPEGEFNLIALQSAVDAFPHIVLTVGGIGRLDAAGRTIETEEPTLVRMHRRHVLGDLFGDLDSSAEGSTGAALRESMRIIQREGRGAIVYLRPTPVGTALHQRLDTPRPGAMFPESTSGTEPPIPAGKSPMAQRDFGIGGQILRELGLRRLRLLTNHPKDLPGLDAFGLEIVEHVPLGCTR